MKITLAALAFSAIALPVHAQEIAEAPKHTAADRPCATQPVPTASDVVAFAIDGDTLAAVAPAGAAAVPHIRIWGIQAPELRERSAPGATGIETTAGMKSRAAMENLLVLTGYKVHIEPTKWDPYCRVVARVTSAEAGDLGLELVQQGMAYGFYLDDAIAGKPAVSVAYGLAEAKARKDKIGLWPMWLGEAK